MELSEEELKDECQRLINKLMDMDLIVVEEEVNNERINLSFDLKRAIDDYNFAGNVPMHTSLYYYIRKSFAGRDFKRFLAFFVVLCRLDANPWKKTVVFQDVLREYSEIYSYFDLENPWVDNEEPIIWFRLKKSELTKYLDL